MPPLRAPGAAPRTRPLLSDRLVAWMKAYRAVANEIELSMKSAGPGALTPGGKLDIATTAATVAASLVAGAELE